MSYPSSRWFPSYYAQIPLRTEDRQSFGGAPGWTSLQDVGSSRATQTYSMAAPWGPRILAITPPPLLHALLHGVSRFARDVCVDIDLRAPHLSLGFNSRYPSQFDWDAPATSPPLDRLRIVCNLAPQWPVDISVSRSTTVYRRRGQSGFSWVTVGDVIEAVYVAMQTPISHEEWAGLDTEEGILVSSTFRRRCRAYPEVEHKVRRGGVRRVDFLGRVNRFRGLTWLAPEQGVIRAGMIVHSI